MPMSRYRVEIAGVAGAAPRDGFIDNRTVERYVGDGGVEPTTFEQTLAKERANVRFDFLQQQMQFEGNVYVSDIVATGASAIAPATVFAFTATAERGDSALFTRDELNDDASLDGAAGLKRRIARALIQSRITNGDIWDPTKLPTPGNATPAARYGVRIQQIEIGPLADNLTAAEALVTLTKL
jgi:hypothetical protein